MTTFNHSGYAELQRRDNHTFMVFILSCIGFICLLLFIGYVDLSDRYKELWAQSEAQNSCLAIAVLDDAQGHSAESLNNMRRAWEAQYDSLGCE